MSSKAYRRNYAEIEWGDHSDWRKPRAEAKGRALYVVKDIEPYVSPLDGTVVSGRRQHRDHMRAHDVVEAGTEKWKPDNPKPLPPLKDDIRKAVEMLNNGYKPRPLEPFNPREYD